MAAGVLFLFFLQAVFFNHARCQPLQCSEDNPSINDVSHSSLPNPCDAINLGPLPSGPMTITSATFTPINDVLASQAGLPGAVVTEVEPDLKFGDVTLSGDLPIGGTIKVSGCFPVFGMVGVDGVVPTFGTAVASGGCQFPALAEPIIAKPKPKPKFKSCKCDK